MSSFQIDINDFSNGQIVTTNPQDPKWEGTGIFDIIIKAANDKYIDKDSRVVKKYMKYYKTEAGAKRALMVLVEYLKDKTTGVSAYFISNTGTVENKRAEKLIYKKD